MARLGLVALLILLGGGVAEAQEGDVALVASGQGGAAAADAFASFVGLPSERRYTEAPDPTPEGVTLLVTIDTDTPLVRVWRRRDDAVLERRFEVAEDDGYALALVATELLEVARSGADPETVGATITTSTPEARDAAAVRAADEAPAEPAPESTEGSAPRALAFALTVGASVEAWLSGDAGSPWLVQPALFLELVATPPGERWVIGGGVFASGLGAFDTQDQAATVVGRYQRYDVGLRLSFGGDVGPVRTRLMAHLRGGGAVVVGRGTREPSGERAEALRGGWSLGISGEARQPLVEGLEVTLELGLDVLPAPVVYSAFGEPLLVESTLRLAGRLGLAWRFA